MLGREKQLLGPPDGVPVLPWYEGAFTKGFVALHPFFRVDGLDPASCNCGTLFLAREERPANVQLSDWLAEEWSARARGNELASIDEIAKRFGEAVQWREIQAMGFADHRATNRALGTHIKALGPECSDPAGAASLVEHCAAAKVFLPTEGVFQPLMERSFVELFRRVGLQEVIVGDEFGDEAHKMKVEDLATEQSWSHSIAIPVKLPRRIYAEDRSLLVAVPWDSFFTFVFGSEDRLSCRIGDLFEGFWCSEETSVSWSEEHRLPLVD